MSLKSLDEVIEDLLLCLLALNHIWVLASVVPVLDVIKINNSVSVDVKLVESLLDKRASVIIHLPANSHNKLVNVKSAIMIGIKEVKDQRNIFLVDADLKIFASLGELI